MRYCCTNCGNLTRFDVVATRTTREYFHYSKGGLLRIENTELVSEHIREVRCRWCDNGGNVVEVSAMEEEQPE